MVTTENPKTILIWAKIKAKNNNELLKKINEMNKDGDIWEWNYDNEN